MESQEKSALKKKIVVGVLLTFFLTGMLTLAFNIQPVKASGTIYIRADGSIDPPTANITTTDNVAYIFTGNNYDEIVVQRSNIIIDGNGYTLQGTGAYPSKGIDLTERSNVTIRNMEIKAFYYGIHLSESSSNTISGNNITANNDRGIYLLKYSSNNSIIENDINNNDWGIDLQDSSNNTVSGNIITNNAFSGVSLLWSYNNKVSGNNVTDNLRQGIALDQSYNNSVSENAITNNSYVGNYSGIYFYSSFNNTISGNIIMVNHYGIDLSWSSNNIIYHNDFIDNTQHAHIGASGYANFWDDGYPSGGNYWSDYNGTDSHWSSGQDETGSDGIADTPYVIDADNKDRYPLMGPFNTFDAGTWNKVNYYVDVVSNSTVSDFYFNPDEGAFLKFNVSGESGTSGFCQVTIPTDLLWVEDGWTITVGDQPVTNYTIIPNQNYTYLYFTYNHSTQTVIIQGNHVIPEFPSFAILPLLMILTIFAVALVKKRLPRKP